MPQTPACTQRSRSEECSEATKIGRQSDAKVIGKASDEVGADIRVYRVCLLDVAPGTPAQMNRNDDESQALCLYRRECRPRNECRGAMSDGYLGFYRALHARELGAVHCR